MVEIIRNLSKDLTCIEKKIRNAANSENNHFDFRVPKATLNTWQLCMQSLTL